MAYVYHAGSQTYFNVNDDVFIIDLESVGVPEHHKDFCACDTPHDLDGYLWEELEPHARPLVDCLKAED